MYVMPLLPCPLYASIAAVLLLLLLCSADRANGKTFHTVVLLLQDHAGNELPARLLVYISALGNRLHEHDTVIV